MDLDIGQFLTVILMLFEFVRQILADQHIHTKSVHNCPSQFVTVMDLDIGQFLTVILMLFEFVGQILANQHILTKSVHIN